jgi:hypothetical protein
MKNYPAPPFQENYVIQLPQSVVSDRELNWTDRIAWHLIRLNQGNNETLAAELGLSVRRLQYHKARLADRGHVARTEERGQIKYSVADADLAALLRIQKFRTVSKCGFDKVPDYNLFALKKQHTYLHILHVMEVLEWTYRIGNEKIRQPHHLLMRSCKTGVTPSESFVPGFWWEELEVKAEQKKQPARIAPKSKVENGKEEHKLRELDKKIESLKDSDKAALMKEAIAEINANGGMPKYGKAMTIKIHMMGIFERREHATL